MKVLLVTGQLAKPIVEKYAKQTKHETHVIALPPPVAALLSPAYISNQLKQRDLTGFQRILIPGLVAGDVSPIEKTTGIATFKGPRHAADLPQVLELLETTSLSRTKPACDVLKEIFRKQLEQMFQEIEANKLQLLKKPGNMLVGNLPVGPDFPIRIIAEIVDAPLRSDSEILERTQYYMNSGADVIDIGMMSGQNKPEDAARCVRLVKAVLGVPVSVDSMNPEEIKAGIDAGADLILSVDEGNAEDLVDKAADVPVVVIPTNMSKSYFPKSPSERVDFMEKTLKKLGQMGFRKLFADLILDTPVTPGLVDSIVAFQSFRNRNPTIPLMLGIGNITELMDADTVGVNAVLMAIAQELNAAMVLTTEVAAKARGSVRESSLAAKMMFVARRRETVPNGIGVELLILKDRKLLDEPYDRNLEEKTQVKESKSYRDVILDPKGCFKVQVDRISKQIIVLYYADYSLLKPALIIKGRDARDMYRTVCDLGLLSKLDHAAYIGSEIQKAEIALVSGKSYVQDSTPFKD